MLSSTYSITDLKKEFKAYGVYGYATDAEFVTALTYALDTAERERMIPVISEATYDTYQAQDKTGLNTQQLNIYFAEIYYGAAEFIMYHDRHAKFNRSAMTETRDQGGAQFTMSGQTGKNSVAMDYIKRADSLIAQGGFIAPVALARRVGIHDYSG